MKKLLLSLLLSAGFFGVKGQTAFFAYFQTEDGFPFYIKMNEQVYRSGSNGSLTLSNLADSTYHITLGMPGHAGEYRYAFRIQDADQGYMIRSEEGEPVLVGLYDKTTLRPQRSQQIADVTFIRRNDAFSALLAKALGDTTLLYQAVYATSSASEAKESLSKVENGVVGNTAAIAVVVLDTTRKAESLPVVETDVKKAVRDSVLEERPLNKLDTTLVAEKEALVTIDSLPTGGFETASGTLKDSTGSTRAHPVVDSSKANIPLLVENQISKQEERFERSVVTRYAESSTSEGFGLVFIDKKPSGADTIRLLIPNPRFVIKQADSTDQGPEQSLFIQRVELDSIQKTKAGMTTDTSIITLRSKIKSNCKVQASDADFFKLRKAMASKENDERMIDEARKLVKSKCFSTEQIKNLSVLFLTSAGKYQFFEMAHPYVSDPELFKTLAAELKDAHYQQRFQLLIGE